MPKIRKIILVIIILISSLININVFGVTDEGYGEDSNVLGQFVDTYDTLDNVTVIVDLIRNSTLDAIELNSTEYTEYIQDPVQLREHKRYAGFNPNVYWTLGAGDLREYTTNSPRGDGYMFINCNAQWLEGKYVRIRWFTVGSLNNRPMYFKVYDGSYDRSDDTDFPDDSAILDKGNGLLYSYRESVYNGWVTRDFLMDLDSWNHTLDTVMICVYLWDGYEWYTRAYWDWIEWNDGAGGTDNIFTIAFTSVTMNEVQEVTGTNGDYSYINNTGLPVTGGGYNENGYLITDDYLNYTTGNSLALLTNTSISVDGDITVQFSNDNSTWVDNKGNVGYTTIEDGFFAIDLRELNYTDIYSMYNFTGILTESPILYQSRLVTTWANSTGGGGGEGETVYVTNRLFLIPIVIIIILICVLGLFYSKGKRR